MTSPTSTTNPTVTVPNARPNREATMPSTTSKITADIRDRVAQIAVEMNQLIKGREDVIHGALVGRVAQQHVLMVGPGGTGKSFLARTLANHISGSKFFEVALDETTDPSQIFGPPDIKAMVEDGKTRRVPTNMLPEATDAFLDEFFNANGPLLHSIMPALNERVWHNNGLPSDMPLRQCLMGTNKLNADADQAALWDRVHLRYTVDYISDRKQRSEMVGDAIARLAVAGRGTTTSIASQRTMVTLEELDTAHAEALSLDMPEDVEEAFLDLREELTNQGVTISDRRMVEGMVAVLSNAWVRGHEAVAIADLDILAAMWWTSQDQQKVAREVIMNITNPGEKVALGLLDELDKLVAKYDEAKTNNADPLIMNKLGIESISTGNKIGSEAKAMRQQSEAAGTNTDRLNEVMDKTRAFLGRVSQDVFGVPGSNMQLEF